MLFLAEGLPIRITPMKLLVARPKVPKEFRIDVHQNARLTPDCRALLVHQVMQGQAKRSLAAEFGISVKTLNKWVNRYRNEGPQGLRDRSRGRIANIDDSCVSRSSTHALRCE
jgi:transposase-like protein